MNEEFTVCIEPVKADMVDCFGKQLSNGVVVYMVTEGRGGQSRRAVAYFGGDTKNKKVGELYENSTPGFIKTVETALIPYS